MLSLRLLTEFTDHFVVSVISVLAGVRLDHRVSAGSAAGKAGSCTVASGEVVGKECQPGVRGPVVQGPELHFLVLGH